MKRCFIIGNGPSQNNVDLSLLKDEITFGMNDIQLRFPDFYPTYWVITDREYWNTYNDIITNFKSHPCIIIARQRGRASYGDRYERISLAHSADDFSHTRGEPIISFDNVGQACLQLAWQRGFHILNLIGFDTLTPNPDPTDHFDPNYLERYGPRNPKPVPEDLWEWGYRVAIDFIQSNGGEIWDVSDGGTGMFPKRSLEESLR
jgi:hypothetical protein